MNYFNRKSNNDVTWCIRVDILGVVQKLRGQDEVGKWSKNASFCPRLG